MEMLGLLKSMGYKTTISSNNLLVEVDGFSCTVDKFYEKFDKPNDDLNVLSVLENLKNYKISIPYNLSIIATINTSDESIYYLDSAFKRRWDWEYVDAPNQNAEVPEPIKNVVIVWEGKTCQWSDFVIKLNEFIKSNHQTIRRIEEKQIGWWFLKSENSVIRKQAIENKLLFYLWDSVFSKDKRPLERLLSDGSEEEVNLITFADLIRWSDVFVKSLIPDENWK